ncbi:MAG TPA: pitrilysin family protein [Rhodanobacteraceae bacterium]|nr:pitrilysin family protein [Rhodanobacteraceae bacterium]
MMRQVKMLAAAMALLLGTAGAGSALGQAPNANANVTRATLDNGLRVVIVRDTLAPVVTTEMNFLVGADEVPDGFPGTAHAVEHMMFRGSPGLSKDQLLAIASDMGGSFNAVTHHGVTQYYFTVPAQDLNVALHVAATRMRGANITQADWSKERGAIEQEVSRDNSSPAYKFQAQLFDNMFAGTPYRYTGLGTRPSFDKTTAADLKKFHDAWYAPNNAILVIAGDVDPASTLKQVKSLFGDIPKKTLPARPGFDFKPMAAKTVKLPSDFPVGIAVLAWRMPGLQDKDYATALVLSDALASKRGKLFEMALTGKALLGQFSGNFLPHAGVGYALAAYPRGGNAQQVLGTMNAIIADAGTKGVPADLVEAAKSKAIADLEYKKNSVSGLANAWSQALAFRDGSSPDDIRTAIAAVTPAEVDALAKRIFDPAHTMTAILTPTSSGKPSASKGYGGAESFGGKPSGAVTLPAWAQADFAKLALPDLKTNPSSFTLANGLRVIVQPESVSKTVEVFGEVKTSEDMQAPKGQEGVANVLDSLFNFGTEHLNRLQFQAALDALSAHESAGSSFSLAVPAANFAKGMQLLADNELHPAMPAQAFAVMQHNEEGTVAGQIQSPAFLNNLHLLRALYPAGDPDLRYATPKSVKGLDLAKVKTYYTQTFRPDMTAIVIIGDVTPDEAHKVAEAAFGSWKAAGAKPDTDYPAVPANKASEFNTPDSSAVQDSVTLAQTIPMNENSPDRYALYMGSQILGGGFDAHLMQDLRVKGGLVYGVYSSVSLQKHRGTFNVNFGCDPDKVGQARAMVVRDVKQMQTTPVTAVELHSAKGKMLRQLALGGSSFGSIASNFLSLSMQGKPLDADAIAAQKYMDMTAAQIQAVFKQDVRPDGFVTAVKGPAPKG